MAVRVVRCWPAVYALVTQETLRLTHRGAIVRDGKLPPGPTPLERAIYNRAYTRVGVADLRQAPKVRQAIRDLRSSLADRGLAMPAWRRVAVAVAVLLTLGFGVWGVVGAARAGSLDTDALFVGVVMTAAAAMWLLSNRTWAGYGELRKLRREHPKPTAGQPVEMSQVDMSATVALYGISSVVGFGDSNATGGLAAWPADWSSADSGGGDSGGWLLTANALRTSMGVVSGGMVGETARHVTARSTMGAGGARRRGGAPAWVADAPGAC